MISSHHQPKTLSCHAQPPLAFSASNLFIQFWFFILFFFFLLCVQAKGNSHWSDRDVGAEPHLLSQLREYGFDVDEGRRVAGDGPRSLLSKGVVFVNAIRTIPLGDRTNSSGDKINEHDSAWEEHVVPLCLALCSESGCE